MSRLILVRHGQAAATWGADPDPGLAPEGRAQAGAMADALTAQHDSALPIVVSPLRRTRETAAALEERWGTRARVEPAVGEIPSPDMSLEERAEWLPRLFQGTWNEAPDAVQDWRTELLDALRGILTDAVVVTHFVAINVVVGAATDDHRVHHFSPGYCSRTLVEISPDGIEVLELGGQGTTVVR